MKFVAESRERRRHCQVRFGCWNVRSLVERDGGLETASVTGNVVENKKINRVADELRRLNITAAGLQETHWFGSGIYSVQNSTVLCSGRPVPGGGDSCRRGEGVGIILNRTGTEAFKAAGCVWRSVSASVVSARLLFTLADGTSEYFTLTHTHTHIIAETMAHKQGVAHKMQFLM